MNDAISVMYHYVWPDDKPIPGGIRPLLASEFETQLDWLSDGYEVTTPGQFLARLRTGWGGRKPPCLLTFDDGTRDHAEVAAPILARRGLSGVFFVLSGPMQSGFMPVTHGMHWLLGRDEKEVWNTFVSYANEHLDGETSLGSPAEAKRIYYYESEVRARIKYAANMVLRPEITEQIVERKAIESGTTLKALATDWFASPEQVRHMYKLGMEIGIHGVHHRSLQTLGPTGITREIHDCSNYLTSLLGQRPTWFACPFGGSGADQPTLAAMRIAMNETGVCAAVTAIKGNIAQRSNPLELPRMDTIDLPPRKTQSVAA